MEQATDGTWISMVPPLVAIGLAIALRHAILSLCLGVYVGILIIQDFNPFIALQRFFDTYLANAIGDESRAAILLFCLLLSGMVAIAASSGGLRGLSHMIERAASTPKRAQVGTWLLGMAVFIDDYANALLVGSTLRPTMDRLKISREKLAFLVDSTAAPVASLAVISSWIAAEVSFVANEFTRLGIDQNPFLTVVASLQYRYYPILMLAFVLIIALSQRDFGPMLKAEQSARNQPDPAPVDEKQSPEKTTINPTHKHGRWYDAFIPIIVTILAMAVGMYIDGLAQLQQHDQHTSHQFWKIFGEARAAIVLLWSSIIGCFTAIALSVLKRILTIKETTLALFHGMKLVLPALVVLVLAWSISDICHELGTAAYLADAVDIVPSALIPATVFAVSAIASFATGSSWGTMGIVFPLVIPIAYSIGGEQILVESIGSVLAGSVFGDHCSPISDTTILSSMATECDLADHVRTQLPYALVVGIVSVIIGEVGVGLGWWNSWVALGLGCAILTVLAFGIGRKAASEHGQKIP